MDRKLLTGIFLVGMGAVCYGLLATIVELAYQEGYTTAEVTVSQYLLGLVVFGLYSLLNNRAKNSKEHRGMEYTKLIAGGTFIGLTGVFYYFSVLYLPVSICVVLLMQTIWMGVVLESLLERKSPSLSKCIAVVIVLAGTILATNAHENLQRLNIQGVLWGLAAAGSYTVAMASANRIALSLNSVDRSLYMVLGAALAVTIVGIPQLMVKFDLSIFWKWGLLLALFGSILPPFLFNHGFPRTGIGLGSILSSVEIPVSVGMALFILNEKVTDDQWVGVLLIICSVVVMNYRRLRQKDGIPKQE